MKNKLDIYVKHKDPEAAEDLTWLLSSGRKILYRETYHLLRSVHERGLYY